ncbi:unnamed protein product [Phytophthora fragariaefolia]|uniref:Unnamed protein product n=1 Tax=Phytophthora fragariaefolia TaxID=1490495 RepID=A0A9W6XUF7_9STRA|nr:unnamed protein product [Phytophthora fragariaefolia]
MKSYLIVCAVLAAVASVQAQEKTNSTVKSIDFSSLKGTVLPRTKKGLPQVQESSMSGSSMSGSSASGSEDKETPKPAVKYIDYSSLKKYTRAPTAMPGTKKGLPENPDQDDDQEQQHQQQQQQQQYSMSGSQDVEIDTPVPAVKPTTRPDPRATEAPTPEPTLPPTEAPTPTPTPDSGPWETKWISHDQVKPFPQPEPVTISEKAAVKFKPQIHITNGCHPYPAVNEAGETGGGLKTKGAPSAGCKGSGWGSQVYGRSTWYRGVWAITYSWYFPKDSPSSGLGHRHDWEHVIVWIDNPDLENPKILAVTPSAYDGYSKQVPPKADCVDGTSVKVNYESSWPINHALGMTSKGGDFHTQI